MSNPKNHSNHQKFKDMAEEEKIINTSDDEILTYVSNNPNPSFQKHLTYIKNLNNRIKNGQ